MMVCNSLHFVHFSVLRYIPESGVQKYLRVAHDVRHCISGEVGKGI